jgi:hypothetical protein
MATKVVYVGNLPGDVLEKVRTCFVASYTFAHAWQQQKAAAERHSLMTEGCLLAAEYTAYMRVFFARNLHTI